MSLQLTRLEDAPVPHRRLFEHVERLLDGHEIGLVTTVALTILTRAIITIVQSRDLTTIDALIDDIAVSLKAGCRAQMERDRKEGFQ